MQDLLQDLEDAQKRLEESITKLKRVGNALAKARRDYYVELAKEKLRLKDEGYAATLIGDLAKGNEHVAALMQKKDQLEILYEATRHSIFYHSMNLRIIENQMEFERKGL